MKGDLCRSIFKKLKIQILSVQIGQWRLKILIIPEYRNCMITMIKIDSYHNMNYSKGYLYRSR